MFGMGGFGGGFGYGNRGRNSGLRQLRYIALVALLILGTAFHHSGSTYDTIRFVYYGVIIGALVYGVQRRRGRPAGMRQGQGGAPPAPVQPGWYPEPGSASVQRYWDGVAWGSRRRWDGHSWVLE